MSVTIAQVIGESGLGLRLVVAPRERLDAQVRWVAVTELADPRPFLAGGELVLTTGLNQGSALDQARFVERVAERGAAGLGFAVGLTHPKVPEAVVAAARRLDLPLLEVPYAIPFIAIDRWVADRVLAGHYGRFRALLQMYDELSRALLSGQGLSTVVDVLRGFVGGDVGVVDHIGSVLASAPATTGWPVEQIATVRADPTAVVAGTPLAALPVEVDKTVVAHLCLRHPVDSLDVLPYAVSLVGLELARRQAVLTGRRELLGQVVEDLVKGVVAPAEAERRLAAAGLDPAASHRVVLGEVDGDEAARDRLRSLPWAVQPPVVTAQVGAQLAVLAGADQPAHELAHLLHGQLRALAPSARVGIGGAYPGVAGLRWSFFEAREALARGPGINDREPLSLSGLILGSQDLPMRELGEDVLRPLLDFDATHAGELVATLRAYLEVDGSVSAVAERLFVHRNTVRYRLAQVERLTGRSLTSTQDRVQLWLALQAVALGAPDRTTAP
ncbi:MAG TPA: PucR family transcriptional regulator ligand-binding domain-containing protein [Actinomycetes bacterium]|nr:PucR family transcriptional regulator ligand-binding domain-containing protein [Actinomycetes bacterium]